MLALGPPAPISPCTRARLCTWQVSDEEGNGLLQALQRFNYLLGPEESKLKVLSKSMPHDLCRDANIAQTLKRGFKLA